MSPTSWRFPMLATGLYRLPGHCCRRPPRSPVPHCFRRQSGKRRPKTRRCRFRCCNRQEVDRQLPLLPLPLERLAWWRSWIPQSSYPALVSLWTALGRSLSTNRRISNRHLLEPLRDDGAPHAVRRHRPIYPPHCPADRLGDCATRNWLIRPGVSFRPSPERCPSNRRRCSGGGATTC